MQADSKFLNRWANRYTGSLRGRREGLGLADRRIAALLFRGHRVNGLAPQFLPDLDPGLGEFFPDEGFREFREFQGRPDPHLVEVIRGGGPDPPDIPHGQVPDEFRDLAPGDCREAVGLVVLGSDLGKHLGDAQAHAHRDPQGLLDLLLYVRGDFAVGGAQCPPQAGYIGKGLVYRVFLDLGGEAPDDVEHPPGKNTVGLIIRREDYEAGAHPARLVQGHPPLHAHFFRRVARAGHDPALAAGDEGLPPQIGIDGFLDGGEKCVAVYMQNGLRPGMDV